MGLFRRTHRHTARASRSGLPLLLLFVVLVPSVCLLWFVNRAAENEQLAVRQKLVDAYRAHLLLAHERLQSHWLRLTSELNAAAGAEPAPALFAQLVRSGVADAIVLFDSDGRPTYPGEPRTPPAEPLPSDWREARGLEQTDPAAAAALYAGLARSAKSPDAMARALQAQARCLLRNNDRDTARQVLTGPLGADMLRHARDPQGRLIAPNAALMALDLIPPEDVASRQAIAARIAASALDYNDLLLGSAQRRFLLRSLQLGGYALDADGARLLAAEDLAVRWLADPANSSREATLRPTGIENVRQLALPGGRLVLLHRTAPLLKRLHAIVASPDLGSDIRVEPLPPGSDSEGALLTLPAGSAMPEWRLALFPLDPRALAAHSNSRSSSYLWIGALTVLTALVLALLTWELLRRQLALTRLRNDLVANVTHELKTPLSSMRLFVETLLNAPPPLDERTTREYLQLIAQENVRLSRLIDNFLTFSRIERNKYVYAFVRVAAATLAERAAGVVRERFQHAGTFAVVIDPALPEVSADADALVTALVNLLDNAWKYSGETKHVVLSARRHENRVEFAVRDHGIGLAPRDRRRIFQRFYQVRPQGSPVSGGCGLGLSIVHSIVAAHHGTITVESELGRGSTFTIRLPIAPPTP